MSLFDLYQKTTQGIVTTLYGDAATWTPAAGSTLYSAMVLYKEPTDKEKAGDQDYVVSRPSMEYFYSDFPGLYEAVQAKSSEVVEINGVEFYPFQGEKKFDGKVIILYLETV